MANTVIQIKRSSTTASPLGGSLSAAELAYSYQSGKLFLGTADGLDTIVIGGKAVTDLINVSFDVANAAFAQANSTSASYEYSNTVGAASNAYAEVIGASGNAYANVVGTSGNAYAEVIGASGNAYTDLSTLSSNNYAGFMANSANSYATDTYLPYAGGILTGDLVINANLTVHGETTYVNTQTILISDNIIGLNSDLSPTTAPTQDAGIEVNRGSAANVSVLWNEAHGTWQFTNNGTLYYDIAGTYDVGVALIAATDYANTVGSSGNAYAVVVGAASNAYANVVGSSANAYTDFSTSSANNYAGYLANDALSSASSIAAGYYSTANTNMVNTTNQLRDYVNTSVTSANAYAAYIAGVVGGAANTNAANGSYISTGVVKVPVGGTGVTSFTTNGVVFGNGSGALQVTSAGLEGQVLTASATGIPEFAMLDGGSF